MATVYYVRDWDKEHENNRTRGLKYLAWVPVPTKLHGEGYTELIDHKNGAAHFGIWTAILKLAAMCEMRGTLVRLNCGQSAGKVRAKCGAPAEGVVDVLQPHDSASIAHRIRIPQKLVDEAIPRLVKIGWLASKDIPDKDLQIPHFGGTLPAVWTQFPGTCPSPERNGTERKGGEGQPPQKKPPKRRPTRRNKPRNTLTDEERTAAENEYRAEWRKAMEG